MLDFLKWCSNDKAVFYLIHQNENKFIMLFVMKKNEEKCSKVLGILWDKR